uniref:Uncharacterized protein n=1 Tax=Mastacembelus armatus TaxID=205130 RepID=A0A3Q3KU41_9TELE
MGCTSAKQVSAVPSDEEGRGKAYSNGDLFTDEYKMKGVEEVKYMRGDENRVNARNQENLVRHTHTHINSSTDSPSSTHRRRPFPDSSSTQANRLVFVSKGSTIGLISSHTHTHTHTHTPTVSDTSTKAHTNMKGGASHAGRGNMPACVECES